ncbi:threonylcarbamoyl-AMP synthase [Arachidicoccus ginsenosidimutans]|uniref:L-threonylcarbamoyladenylate synthase n=1 Tax=Arachidicoccus sp. BS20 TaxID=1850526 RepID=UPI0007F0F7AC|nr:L-threonylcarbamoyladenylate synthase [Arachidicoccus sp. BS20]ANI88345.1 threonylcarbamoyl-AMP synthase [Arachidicoccus sp. BS20]
MLKDFEKDIEQCLAALQSHGTILYPTDTVWGLGCDATDEFAVQKIIQIKNRPAHKSFVVLVDDAERLQQYVDEVAETVIQHLSSVKKPTTIIYPNAKGLAESAVATDFSVAIRICKDEFCKELIQQFDKPILSTSANKSGEPAPRIFKEIDNEIIRSVDYVVHYRQDDEKIATLSSIVKFDDGKMIVVRA